MKMAKVFCLCFVLLLVFTSVSFAAADTARSLGMGGAMIAVQNDLAAPYINPACTAFVKKTSIGLSASYLRMFMHAGKFIGEETSLPENVGILVPVGPGAFYIGQGLLENSKLASEYFGSENLYQIKLNAPSASYAMLLMPDLAVGGTVSLMSRVGKSNWSADNGDFEDSLTKYEGSSGTVGMMYSAGPSLDLGASATFVGHYLITGNDELRMGGPEDGDYEINGVIDNPSTARFGCAWRPDRALTVGAQFDLLPAFSFDEKKDVKLDSYYDVRDNHLRGDSVIVSHFGVEYVIDTENGRVPFWAGAQFTPTNNLELDRLYLDEFLAYTCDNTSSYSFGMGYGNDNFDVGIAVQFTRGLTRISEMMIIEDTKAVVSGTIKI